MLYCLMGLLVGVYLRFETCTVVIGYVEDVNHFSVIGFPGTVL